MCGDRTWTQRLSPEPDTHIEKERAVDVLAYSDRPHTSNRRTEAINVRLVHFRGSALGFQNLTNYITHSLLEANGFKPHLDS